MQINAQDNVFTLLKSFMLDTPNEKKDLLLAFLPQHTQEKLHNAPSVTFKLDVAKTSLFDCIHWSWFIPFLETLNSTDRKIFFLAFSPSVQKSIAKHFSIQHNPTHTTAFTNQYLRKVLVDSVVKTPPLGIHLLPQSGLNLLLKIEKKKLTELIDILSLFDLSAEIRHIVETKILKKIYSFLKEEEMQFLQQIAGQKEPYAAAQIQLDKWDGTESSLRKTMHKIGLTRLGSALSGQDNNLIWYVIHRLDIGRGQTLEKLCKQETSSQVATWLIDQLKELL